MTVRDEFFWLGEINKATLVINSRQGLLPMPIAEEAAKALREVLADGEADPTKRAKTYITFEPLMLKKADPVITLMHAGRSSQDMHATYRSAILRDHVLEVGDALNAVLETMTDLADKNRETVVPNYTNGVAAQPNSLAHYLLAFLAGFSRDAQKLRQFYVRLDRCPMGSTVLNGRWTAKLCANVWALKRLQKMLTTQHRSVKAICPSSLLRSLPAFACTSMCSWKT